MRRELARWVAMLFAVLGLACAAPEPPDTPVARVSARTADLALLLERLAQLEGTPLGRRSAALAAALPSCAVVEARGYERFGLIADALGGDSLAGFYREITDSEARHADLFVDLSLKYFEESIVEARLAELIAHEAEILQGLAIRAALH